tara:strand:+ start:1808 stop:2269 length:462 start_codon:yes stop_codon:yes gene_type:complete
MKAQNILTIPRKIWATIGGKTVTRIVKDSDKGFGTNENTGKRYKFSGYTSSYSTKKSEGKAGAKGVSKSRQINPPNLRLTGTMLNSIKAQKATNIGVDIIYRDGLKVKGNADNGRNIFGVNDVNENKIVKELSDYINRNVEKYANKTVNIKIG